MNSEVYKKSIGCDKKRYNKMLAAGKDADTILKKELFLDAVDWTLKTIDSSIGVGRHEYWTMGVGTHSFELELRNDSTTNYLAVTVEIFGQRKTTVFADLPVKYISDNFNSLQKTAKQLFSNVPSKVVFSKRCTCKNFFSGQLEIHDYDLRSIFRSFLMYDIFPLFKNLEKKEMGDYILFEWSFETELATA